MDNYFTKEADIMVDNVYDLNRISLEYLHLTGAFTKLACLNVKLTLLCPSTRIYILILYI